MLRGCTAPGAHLRQQLFRVYDIRERHGKIGSVFAPRSLKFLIMRLQLEHPPAGVTQIRKGYGLRGVRL